MPWLAFGTLTRRLADGETVVGSGADADWRVATADLMPRHFVVTVHGLNTSIRGSSADVVVVVNGNQLGPEYHLLNEGDSISAGRGRFLYSDEQPRADDAIVEPLEDAYFVDEEAGLAHPLARRSTTIGRDISNTIVIRDPRASRFHAEVRREAGGFALHSMGAAGTALNGETMTGPAMLHDGDSVEIAYTGFRFLRGALAPGMTLAPEVDATSNEDTRTPTAAGRRVTIQSTTRATNPPASNRVMILIIGLIGLLVVAGALFFSRGL